MWLATASCWEFHEGGDRLPFERADRYAAARKADRLDEQVLREYADALGIRLADPAAYGDDVTLLKWSNEPRRDAPSALRTLLRVFDGSRRRT